MVCCYKVLIFGYFYIKIKFKKKMLEVEPHVDTIAEGELDIYEVRLKY